ncbi:uncharacterized protein LOC118203511, partial [Stegodyphus dumicola]|uniref:uncharacterized protein LOC118203511 n=1 Tax=Stegodyphus dumicola TaxID=202533 RepID=UPI0015B304C5
MPKLSNDQNLNLKICGLSLVMPTVKDFYASHKIQWCYITEKAAWWGGFYERLIKSVKLALRKTLRKSTLSREELETLIIEIEGVLNSRPLTYVYSELQEPMPLTPAHMLLGRRVNSRITEFKVNDIVLIHDEKLPRHSWKLGRVVTIFPSRDGKDYSIYVMKVLMYVQ